MTNGLNTICASPTNSSSSPLKPFLKRYSPYSGFSGDKIIKDKRIIEFSFGEAEGRTLGEIESLPELEWIKNFFVFGALIFSCSFLDINKVIISIVAFVLFCLASSTVYIMNDVLDVEKDKVHPKKKMCGI